MAADEFDVIRTLFAPLATSADARGLADDVAVLEANGPFVVTTDAIVEGVHFLSDDPIETVAMKALRVNVSDIVAKGAKPVAALLTLIWPKDRPAAQIAIFAEGLARDLKFFDIALIGGDTTSTDGPLTVSVTMFGVPFGTRTPSRADARTGEDVWLIGGEIGSAWMGLELRTRRLTLDDIRRGRDESQATGDSRALAREMPDYLTLAGAEFDAEAAWLMSTYLAPFVRPECAGMIARFASASMDVSDGLITDARKLAAASGVKLTLEANAIPLSIPGERWAFNGGDVRKLWSGGDDYVVLFTAPAAARDDIAFSEQGQALRLTRIGVVEAGEGVSIVDARGQPVPIADAGYSHQLGR